MARVLMGERASRGEGLVFEHSFNVVVLPQPIVVKQIFASYSHFAPVIFLDVTLKLRPVPFFALPLSNLKGNQFALIFPSIHAIIEGL